MFDDVDSGFSGGRLTKKCYVSMEVYRVAGPAGVRRPGPSPTDSAPTPCFPAPWSCHWEGAT